jgi:predicted RNA-binding Zn-ribbon protein involved in translation (DUF1610 family)
MDFTPLLQPLLGLWYLIPLFIIVAILKTPWFKGVLGEFIVNQFAQWQLDENHYHLVKNVTLPTEDGGTTQIDHIIVSTYGVFVVETKNIKGWIFGSEHQRTWTQQIYKHKSKFQNPLHQNYKHCKTLQALLELNDEQLHSVVVFIGDSTFKCKLPDNVTYGMGYIRYIKSKQDKLISPKLVIEILNTIESDRLTRSFKTNREHAAHVQTIIADKQNQNACPKCGSEMVLRTTKRGDNKGREFWGCSNYPKCRSHMAVAE